MATKKTTKSKAKKPAKKAAAKEQVTAVSEDIQIPQTPATATQTETSEAEAQVDITTQTEAVAQQPTPPDVVQVTPQVDASTPADPAQAPTTPSESTTSDEAVIPKATAPQQPAVEQSQDTHSETTPQQPVAPQQPGQQAPPTEKQPEESTPPPFSENEAIFAEDDESGPSIKKLLLIFLSALVIGALIVGAYFYWQSSQVQSPTPEGETTEEPTPEPEDTEGETEEATDSADLGEDEDEEESTVEFSGVSVQVLNGSGTAGEAGAVQALLEDAGFDTFETGNADSYDYTDTEIQIKESVDEEAYDAIVAALEDTYTVVQGDPLDEDAQYDIVVIVGQQN